MIHPEAWYGETRFLDMKLRGLMKRFERDPWDEYLLGEVEQEAGRNPRVIRELLEGRIPTGFGISGSRVYTALCKVFRPYIEQIQGRRQQSWRWYKAKGQDYEDDPLGRLTWAYLQLCSLSLEHLSVVEYLRRIRELSPYVKMSIEGAISGVVRVVESVRDVGDDIA